MEFKHKSILLDEVIENLNIKEDGVYVDGTLGGGGHSYEIAKRLSDAGKLIGIDQDEDAIAAATKRLDPFKDRVCIVKSNYENMIQVLKEHSDGSADGILLDLGVSSYQLDDETKGFSYRFKDAPLDMRMDKDAQIDAAYMLNNSDEQELFRIIKTYGEERYAKNIARNIVKARQKEELRTSGQLVRIIDESIPAKSKREGGHPAKRTFQAIRIACNRELEVLEDTLENMIDALRDGGRICVITFHSLEDRIVKNIFKKAQDPCTCPPDFPVCVCGKKSKGKVITRKPIIPSDEEMEENPRSKSAKLRVFERQTD